MLFVSLFLSCLYSLTFATTGVDLSTVCGAMSCLKGDGIDFTIPRAWYSYGAFDSSSITNLNYAWNADIPYNDVYLFPCRGKSASQQVDDLINDLSKGLNATQHLRKKRSKDFYKKLNISIPKWRKHGPDVKYGMIWMDIEINPSGGCGWGTNYASNCQYLEELLSAAVAKGASPGVYSSEGEWESVMGSRSACASSSVTKYPIWYAHYDGNPSFSDWSSTKFGGWASPAIKQYRGDVTLCGCGIDENWY